MVLIIAQSDVKQVLSMPACINAVEDGFRQLALGNVDMPLRSRISIQRRNATVLIMPAYIAGMEALASKVVSVCPDNPSKYNLPTTSATILLNDPTNGRLLSLMDGTHITAMRTGAVSGVATKYLARSDARVAGVFGAGAQARTQLMGMCAVRGIVRANVYDVATEAAKKYVEEMGKMLGIDVRLVDDSKKAVKDADIVATATTSTQPLFDGSWLEEGVHINGIGSHSPNTRELDEATIKRSKIVVDSMDAALKEAGDIMIPLSKGVVTKENLYAELGEVVAGTKPGRTSEKEITLFKSLGLAVQDASTALLVYNEAKKKGIGREVQL